MHAHLAPVDRAGENGGARGNSCGVVFRKADLIGDVDPSWLRNRFPGGLIYTLRSTAEGGGCADGRDLRERRLIAAADRYEYVDLEAERDLRPAVLERTADLANSLSGGDGRAWVRRLLRQAGTVEIHPLLRQRFDEVKAVEVVEFTALLEDVDRFRSKSKNSPFDGRPSQGRVLRTVVDGRTVHPVSG